MMTWAERVLTDPTLAAWRNAEVARAHVELQALRVEHAHQAEVIQALQQQLEDLKETTKRKKPR